MPFSETKNGEANLEIKINFLYGKAVKKNFPLLLKVFHKIINILPLEVNLFHMSGNIMKEGIPSKICSEEIHRYRICICFIRTRSTYTDFS